MKHENNRESVGRRDYDDAHAALDRHIVANNKRLRKFFLGALCAFVIIGLGTTAALIGFSVVLKKQHETDQKLTVLVKTNKLFSERIQKQRAISVRENCESQNSRNRATQQALKNGSDLDQENAPNEAVRREIRRRRDVTIGLINAIVPIQNCDYQVNIALGKAAPTPVPTPKPKP